MTINKTIISILNRTKRGFTADEVFDRLQRRFARSNRTIPLYSSVRAEIRRMLVSGKLSTAGSRKSSRSGHVSTVYALHRSSSSDA